MDIEKNTGTEVQEGSVTESKEQKTYTEEEVQKLLQSEADRRVTEALKKANKKKEEEVKEAQKLAAMNEQEKYEYQLKQREQAIIEKEKALALAENKNEASKILSEKGLSLSLVDFVVAEDAETMKANIDLLDKAFKASVKAEIEKRIGSSSPKKTSISDSGAITKQMFSKMSIEELNQLYKENPDLFKQLSDS